jgi:hypothetical protein
VEHYEKKKYFSKDNFNVSVPGWLSRIRTYFLFRILHKKGVQNKTTGTYFLPDQVITVVPVNFQTKFSLDENKLRDSFILFYYPIFNFGHVWDPGSGKKSSRFPVLGVEKHRFPDPQHLILTGEIKLHTSVK